MIIYALSTKTDTPADIYREALPRSPHTPRQT